MKKNILNLLFLGLIFPLVSCGDNKAVTSEEWDEAIENITNVNKQNTLNYFASSDVTMYPCEDFDKLIINSIEVNGNIQEVKETIVDNDEGEEIREDRTLKIVKDGVFSILVSSYYNDFNTMSFNQIFDMILDLYGNQQYFTYKDNKYRCEEEYKEYYSNFVVEVTFENKLIKSIFMDYKLLDNTYSLKGAVTFEYGKSTLSLTEEEQKRFDSAYVNVKKDELPKTFLVPGKERWGGDCDLHFKIETADIEDRRKFYIQQQNEKTGKLKNILFRETKYTLIAFNDVILTCGKSSEEGDYYFSDDNTIIYFNKDISKGTLKMEVSCTGVSFAKDAIVYLEKN